MHADAGTFLWLQDRHVYAFQTCLPPKHGVLPLLGLGLFLPNARLHLYVWSEAIRKVSSRPISPNNFR